MHDLNETNPGLTLFSAVLPLCCFLCRNKSSWIERNFARIFYTIEENFWIQEPPEGGAWVGTTHQGAPLQARPGGLSPPGGPADPEIDAIKSYFWRKNQGERIITFHEMEPPSPPVLHREARSGARLWLRRGEIFGLRHHQPSFIANCMMLPAGSE